MYYGSIHELPRPKRPEDYLYWGGLAAAQVAIVVLVALGRRGQR